MIQEKVNQALEILDEVISTTPLTRSDRQIVEEALALVKQLAIQGAISLEARITKDKVQPAIDNLVVNRAGLDNTISNKTVIG